MSLQDLPERGIYVLVISISRTLRIKVGKLGEKTFRSGYYAYTGSALGRNAASLPFRLARHLKTAKKKHWHIDFLLADSNARIEATVAVSCRQNLECQINQLIRSHWKAETPVPQFGASDCKNKCGSHLLYFGSKDVKDEMGMLFKTKHPNCVFLDLPGPLSVTTQNS